MTGDTPPRADDGSSAAENADSTAAASTTRLDGGSATGARNRRWSRSGRALSTLFGRPIVAVVVAVVTAFLTVPVLVAFVSSFAESGSGVLPTGFVTFDHWRKVLGFGEYGVRQNAVPGLTYSLLIATGGMVLNVLIGVPIAYALARYDFYARDWINTFAILPLVPGLILGIAFIQTYPEHGRSSLGLLAGYCLLKSPYMVLTVQSSFQSMDLVRLEESARSLGASWPRTFLTVIVPHAKRGIVAGAIITWTLAAAEFNFTHKVASGSPDPFAMFLYRNIANNALYLQSAAAVSVYFLIVVAAIVVLQLLGKRGFSTAHQ
ncbi:binding-protein-dependent transport systems inner membrane component [Natrinema pellirubrum DSM 15624]|uniref:ABC-type spermidine/putrescine transport system, permease component II n=1 Tax=Natrinema pellirubrum (strain DSM 15624 / CIP 106293 / JCM 10476 / NCIMB 786 / 157) TaxID=797303 RepID=L0JFL8_NATP1|nr:ABC transporter permease subunit [Natrinema pellirubrum]AGB30300.1 ABC-type spermidine/putrescine transport system, permease component II [Natrinema pellirubrum DSM 15624]ELY79028.1 binding-protein-dependent transport systems inner membrane component [Natrinema pellirubrum DSM 15624]